MRSGLLSRRSTPLFALCVMLSACGGGGGGVGSNPAPPPAPPPSVVVPTSANTDLISLTKSEDFTNDAASLNAAYSLATPNNPTTSITQKQTLSILYDAAAKSYKITVAGRSLTFLATDLSASQSSAAVTVYEKKSGTVTDTVTLTNPGTTGRFTYKFVGGAFWQRVDQQTSTGSVALDAASYGVETPDGAVPRTGTASYAVDLVGMQSGSANVTANTGSGTLDVDFGTGTVVTQGVIKGAVQGDTVFHGEARMSSSANGFTGTFRFFDFGGFNGSLNGRFYGPNGEEVGATYAATYNNNQAVGVLIGRKTGALTANADFTALTNDQFFASNAARTAYTQSASAPTGASSANDAIIVHYNASTRSYTLIAPDRSVYFSSQQPGNGPQSDVYTGTTHDRLELPSGALTYVRGLRWITESGSNIVARNIIFGMTTADAAVPRTGRGGYGVTFFGQAADPDYPNRMEMSGSGALLIDFASGAVNLSGGLNYREDWFISGRAAMTAVGAIKGSGQLSSSANLFNGSLTIDGIGAYGGSFDGRLFGPVGQEVGGSFTANDGATGKLSGGFTGAADSTIVAAQTKLGNLSAPLTVRSVAGLDIYQIPTDITIDPAAGTRRFVRVDGSSASPLDVTLGAADRDAARSNADYDVFVKASGGTMYNAAVLRGTSPLITLSYVSFANITNGSQSVSAPSPAHFYVPFGVATPAALQPRSGTANYSGIAVGNGRVDTISTNVDVSGTSSVQADFGAGTMGLGLVLSARDAGTSNALTSLGTFSFNGQIATNGFFGNAAAYPSYNGLMTGQFYGPAADEYGAVWNLDSAAGPVQFAISGVAIGKKN